MTPSLLFQLPLPPIILDLVVNGFFDFVSPLFSELSIHDDFLRSIPEARTLHCFDVQQNPPGRHFYLTYSGPAPRLHYRTRLHSTRIVGGMHKFPSSPLPSFDAVSSPALHSINQ